MGQHQRSTLIEPKQIDTPSIVSDSAMRACASFGLIPKHTHQKQVKVDPPSHTLLERIGASRVVLIVGPSGAGKSCRLRGIERALGASSLSRVHVVDACFGPEDSQQPMIDLLGGTLESRAATLAYAGLAEPGLWAMPASCLSVGQRARLALAKSMHGARVGDVLIADEFATPLDRANAYSLAKTMRRWARQQRVTLIAASAHEDLEAMLAPDLVIDMNADINTDEARSACPPIDQPIRIEEGTIADYQALAHLHYRAPKPATHTLILRAIRAVPILGEILAGVLVVSMPTLNGAWRDRAWPGFFSSGSKSFNANQINTHLRCISRVIVEPRSRGLGVASDLVRAYLRSPQTSATEAIAAMGAVCPFFERAGMISYHLPPSPIDLRLLDALAHTNQSPADLIESPIEADSLIERELITWSKARKIIGAGTPDAQTIQKLAPIAACRLLAKPRAYAHVKHQGDDGDDEEQTR